MLRFVTTTRKSSASIFLVQQSRRRQVASSTAGGSRRTTTKGGPARFLTASSSQPERKVLEKTSLEVIFQQRLEQQKTKVQNQQKTRKTPSSSRTTSTAVDAATKPKNLGDGDRSSAAMAATTAAASTKATNKLFEGGGRSSGISPSLRSVLRQGSQQQQEKNGRNSRPSPFDIGNGGNNNTDRFFPRRPHPQKIQSNNNNNNNGFMRRHNYGQQQQQPTGNHSGEKLLSNNNNNSRIVRKENGANTATTTTTSLKQPKTTTTTSSSSAATIRQVLAQQSTVAATTKATSHNYTDHRNRTRIHKPSSIADMLKGTSTSSSSSTSTSTYRREQQQQQRETLPWTNAPASSNSKSSSSSMRELIRNVLTTPQPTTATSAASSSASSAFSPNENERKKRVDMSDISHLRDAFLKSTQQLQQQEEQQRRRKGGQPQDDDHQRFQRSQQQQPAWRRDGAKGFRKRLQEQQRQQRETLEHQRRMRAAVNRTSGASFMTQEDFMMETVVMHHKKEERTSTADDAAEQRESDRTVVLPPREVTVTELSALFRVKIDTLLDKLMSLGERPTDGEDHLVDLDVMELLAMELGLEPVRSSRRRSRHDDDKNLLLQRRAGAAATDAAMMDDGDDNMNERELEAEAYESLPPRPPVVCILGHVDHGKTTLMDALRQRSKHSSEGNKAAKKKSKSKKGKKVNSTKDGAVAGTEAGGITQVISAFQVPLESQENAVTFLDTPGHAAFRAMRESGSNAADVIVLVVAADDGVSQQTVEIINFYKSIVKGAGDGGISMVVAMTKIDKHGIDVNESRQRIENQLLEHGILSESFGSPTDSEYGPPVQVIPVSGLTGEGLDDLIEGLVLQSEVMDLRADEKAQAEGLVMDARMEKGVGVVADCIVRWGSLERGNVVVSGVHSGKVKALKDMSGVTIKSAAPSQPVRIIGFKSLPKAGDPIVCVHSEEVADQITERREALQDAEDAAHTSSNEGAEFQVMGAAAKRGTSMDATLVKYGHDGEADETQIRIPVIIRADGEGSLAALKESLVAVGDESLFDLVVDPINAGIGPISTSDVRMAIESGASIFSFGIKQNDKTALSMAEAEGVQVRSHDVIYSLLDEAKELFAERLPASPVDVVHGRAKVQAIFDVNNKKDAERIAGLSVLDGTLYKEKAKGTNGDLTECRYRVLRKGDCISEGDSLEVSSLRKVKEDVDAVRRGEECGLGLEDFTDYEKGDIIECYSVEMKQEFV